MRYYFFILAALLLFHTQSQSILLTPILPASAFENQFYQVRFRVRNLVGARFQFKNVPPFFTVSSEGQISGVPTKQGLYPIEVTYFNDTYRDTKEVIIEVRRGTKLQHYESESQQVVIEQNRLKAKEQYQFTYNQGDELSIQVRISDGVAPYRFEVIYMPLQLDFNNKTGGISGAFSKYGQYIMGIRVKDNRNKQVQVLIKVIVNIKNRGSSNTMNSQNSNKNINNNGNNLVFHQRSLIELSFDKNKSQQPASNTNPNSIKDNNPNSVSNSNNQLDSSSTKSMDSLNTNSGSLNSISGGNVSDNKNIKTEIINNNNIGTITTQGGAINIISSNDQTKIGNNTVDIIKTNVEAKNTIAGSTKTNSLPQSKINNNKNQNNQNIQTQPNTQSTTPSNKTQYSQPIIPQSITKQAQSDKKSQQILPTESLLNKNITNDPLTLQKIQQQKDQLNKKLQLSKTQLKLCYDNVSTFRTNLDNLLNSYNQQFAKVDSLKNQLQQLKTKSQRTSTDLTEKLDKLKIFQIQKTQAQQQYNRSLSSYENVNFAYTGSLTNINKNLQDIQFKQKEIDKNQKQLDSLYKTLDQTLTLNNQLEQHKNQLNQQIKNGIGLANKIDTTKVNFGGCQNYKFNQKSIGVGQVKKAIDKTYLLTNNHFITFGDCTEHTLAKPGDFIQWKGYLWKGSVSALSIKKLK